MSQDHGFKAAMVIGAGQMGSGIAQVLAITGVRTIIVDQSAPQLEQAEKSIKSSLSKMQAKAVITKEQGDAATGLLSFEKDCSGAASVDLAIEAIVEKESAKVALFQQLDALMPANSILASNTSSIPITRLAAATKRPDKVIGMHFMNPVPIMKLVEIISGMATAAETRERIASLAKAMGKEISSSQDYPGFVVNRILMPMINEAFYALMEGVASAEDIDRGMKLGTNQPMGPLTLADFIGLDTCYSILKVLHEGLGDSKYRPCPLLAKYVEAGFFGRKSKRGVYVY